MMFFFSRFVLFSTTIRQYFSLYVRALICYVLFILFLGGLCLCLQILFTYARKPNKTNTNGKQHINCTHSHSEQFRTIHANVLPKIHPMDFCIESFSMIAVRRNNFVSEINLLGNVVIRYALNACAHTHTIVTTKKNNKYTQLACNTLNFTT